MAITSLWAQSCYTEPISNYVHTYRVLTMQECLWSVTCCQIGLLQHHVHQGTQALSILDMKEWHQPTWTEGTSADLYDPQRKLFQSLCPYQASALMPCKRFVRHCCWRFGVHPKIQTPPVWLAALRSQFHRQCTRKREAHRLGTTARLINREAFSSAILKVWFLKIILHFFFTILAKEKQWLKFSSNQTIIYDSTL